MRRNLLFGMIFYLFCLFCITLSPFRFHLMVERNWIGRAFQFSYFDVTANFLLFIPFGVLLYFLSMDGPSSKYLRSPFLLSAFVSLAIEGLQIFIPERFPSPIDLFLNTAGGGSGFLLAGRIYPAWKRRIERHSRKLIVIGWLCWSLFILWVAAPSWERLDRWRTPASLRVGNSADERHPWYGDLFLVALYDRAFRPEEIERHYRAGRPAEAGLLLQDRPIALYLFDEGEGALARDRSGLFPPLHLELSETDGVSRLEPAGLSFRKGAVLTGREAATRLQERIGATHQFTVEVWMEPAAREYQRAGRLLSLSTGPGRELFFLQQTEEGFDFQVRNRFKGGFPKWNVETVGLALPAGPIHLVAIYDLGRMSLSLNGEKVAGAVLSDGFFLLADFLALTTISVGGRALLGLLLFSSYGLLTSLTFRGRSIGRLASATLFAWCFCALILALQIRHPVQFFTVRTAWVPFAATFLGTVSGRFLQSTEHRLEPDPPEI